MINAIIADDNKDLCMTLANELNVTKEMKVLEMINDGTKVIQEIKRLKPEIIILDLKMPGRNGLQIIEDIENDDSIETKVVVFSGEMNYIAKAKNYNCVISYLTKILCFEEIVLRIQQIAQDIGGKSINQKILEYLLDLGFSTSKQGTTYLKDCIRIFLLKREEECKVKELFKMVANTNGVPSYRVKNNIHTSTQTVWKKLGNQEYITDKLKLGYTEEMSPKKVITMAQYYIDID